MHSGDADDAGRTVQSARCSVVPMSRLTNEMSEVRDVAEGSFGVVRCYRHDFDQHEYAVKQTKRTICGESNLQQQLQESFALSSFPHRHIVRYFDSWVEDRVVFAKLERLDDSVATLARPVSEAVLTAMLHQISIALYDLHVHDVMHMDVKPENILRRQLDGDTFIFKLCDFGLARPLEVRESLTGEKFLGLNDDDGDRRYMSPELLKKIHDVVGPPADVYALGKSCKSMMANGLAPDECPTTGTRQLGAYSASFVGLVESMLREEPAERPSAFDVVRATLPSRLTKDPRLLELQHRIDAARIALDEPHTDESAASISTPRP